MARQGLVSQVRLVKIVLVVKIQNFGTINFYPLGSLVSAIGARPLDNLSDTSKII